MAELNSLSRSQQIASDLLDIGVFSFRPESPYTWASGLMAPVYCDNRLTLSYPVIRSRIVESFVKGIEENRWNPEVMVGVATAGIPHAAFLASRYNIAMAYVRSKPKAHGQRNQIEGIVREGQRVIVVEDLVSTGGSVVTAVKAVQDAGADVVAVTAIFSYGFPAAEDALFELKVPFFVLVTFEQLLITAQKKYLLTEEQKSIITKWQRDPQAWTESWRSDNL